MRESSPTPYVGPPPVPKMPAGLVDLIEGMTREVLKNNPRDLYGFCAKHLEKLLEVRDGRPVKNPVLTLEEKILRAQEKVRQRAKERRERYDCEINALKQSVHQDVDIDKTMTITEEITAKGPEHEDHNLALASEVEIAHKSYDDEISIDKSNVLVRLPEISIIKPDDDTSNFQQVDANEEIADQSIDKKMRLSPGNDEIVSRGNNYEAIENVTMEESNTQSISNEELDQEKIIEEGEKQETKDTGVEVMLEKPSVIVDAIQNEESTSVVSVTDTENEANILFSTEKTETNSSENSETAIPVIENNITEPQIINDSVDEALSVNQNETKSDDDVHGDVIIEDTDIVKDNVNIDNEKSHTAFGEVDRLSSSPQELEPDAVNENSPETDTENIDTQESLKNEAIISIQNYSPTDDKESIPAENTPIKDDVSLETIQNVNDANVNQNISIEDLDGKEVKPAENKSLENFLEVNDDSVQTNLDVTKDDSIGDVKVLEDSNSIEATTEEKIQKVNNDSSSVTHIPEKSDVNEDTKSLTESDVSKLEDVIAKENQNDQSNMDLETAAVTIQKVFRSFLFKSRNSTFDDITNDEPTSLEEDSDKKEDYYAAANINKERRTLGINRMDTVLQTVNEEKSLSLSTDDSSTLSSAATTIQAHVRGFLVRNRLNSNKTVSTTSLANSNENLEFDTDQQKNKTVLNIHIVPEEANYLSRDESIITSMELSLDGSPPSSISLHPLGYDVSERRKLLKREDAVQSISPPSNNSGKLSEESVKEVFINDDTILLNDDIEKKTEDATEACNDSGVDSEIISTCSTVTATTVINVTDHSKSPTNSETQDRRSKSLPKMGSDESDVVTPYEASPRSSIGDYENTSKLVHSGEFHDVLLPTRVSRNDTTVVREFKNVLVYFFIWNHS